MSSPVKKINTDSPYQTQFTNQQTIPEASLGSVDLYVHDQQERGINLSSSKSNSLWQQIGNFPLGVGYEKNYWEKASNYASQIYNYFENEFKTVQQKHGQTIYSRDAANEITRFVTDRAQLKPESDSTPIKDDVPFGTLLKEAFGEVEPDKTRYSLVGIQPDPLRLYEKDPYQSVPAAYVDETGLLLTATRRFSIAIQNLDDYYFNGQIDYEIKLTGLIELYHAIVELDFLASNQKRRDTIATDFKDLDLFLNQKVNDIKQTRIINNNDFENQVITLQNELKSGNAQIPFITNEQDVFEAIQDTKPIIQNLWQKINAKAFIFSPPGNSENADGQLPDFWKINLKLFESSDQEALYLWLIDPKNDSSISTDEKTKILQAYSEITQPKYAGVTLIVKERDQKGNMLSFASDQNFDFKLKASEKKGYGGLFVTPSRSNVEKFSKDAWDDIFYYNNQYTLNYKGTIWFDNPLWSDLDGQAKKLIEDFKNKKSPYLDAEYVDINLNRSGDLESFQQDKEDRHQKLVKSVEVTAALIIEFAKRQSALSMVEAVIAKNIKISMDQALEKNFEKAWLRQYGKILTGIADFFQGSDANKNRMEYMVEKDFPSENNQQEKIYSRQFVKLIRSFGQSLTGERIAETIHREKAIEALTQVYEAINQASITLSLSDDPLIALSHWKLFETYKNFLKDASLNGSKIVLDFLLFKTEASTFENQLKELDSAEQTILTRQILSDTGLDFETQLETDVLKALKPNQAESFVNRLRYVLYFLKYNEKEEKVNDQTLEERISSNINTLTLYMDGYWPKENGSAGRHFYELSTQSALKADINFTPKQEYFLNEKTCADLLSSNQNFSVGERVSKLTTFFMDYNDGYYPYFARLAFEKNSKGANIKAIRDHSFYFQLVFVLDDIASYANELLKKENISEDQRKSYQETIHVAEQVAYNIRDTLSDYPFMPYWIINEDIGFKDAMPHEVLLSSKIPTDNTANQEALLQLERNIYLSQIYPWYIRDADHPIGQLIDNHQFINWVDNERKKPLFYPADFQNWTRQDCEEIVDDLNRLIKKIEIDATIRVTNNFLNGLKDIFGHLNRDFRSIKFEPIRAELNKLILDSNLYQDNRTLFDLLDANSLHLTNAELILLIHPKFKTQVHKARHDLELYNTEIKIFEEQFDKIDKPQPLDFIDWYQESASANEVVFFIGRLIERTSGLVSSQKLIERQKEIDYEISRFSFNELEALANYHDQKNDSTHKLPETISGFIGKLDIYEKIWIPAYVKQKLLASKREQDYDMGDVYYEYIRQIDVNRFLLHLNLKDASKIRDDFLSTFCGNVAESASWKTWLENIDEHKVDELYKGIKDYFSGVKITDKRKKLERLYSQFNVVDGSEIFTPEETLIITLRLSQINAGKPTNSEIDEVIFHLNQESVFIRIDKINDFFASKDFSDLSSQERRNFYHYLYSEINSTYKQFSDDYLRRGVYLKPGIFDEDISLDEDKQNKFWLWLNLEMSKEYPLDENNKLILIQEMDRQLDQDIFVHHGIRVLDTVTEKMLQYTLDKMIADLEVVTEPTNQISLRIDKLKFIRNALFESFDPLKEKEFENRSLYNPNIIFRPRSPQTLTEIFQLGNIEALCKSVNNDFYYVQLGNQENAKTFFQTFINVLNGLEPQETWEKSFENTWADLKLLEKFLEEDENNLSFWNHIQNAVQFFSMVQLNPHLQLPPKEIKSRLDILDNRLKQRLIELQAEEVIIQIGKIICSDYSDKNPDLSRYHTKKRQHISEQELIGLKKLHSQTVLYFELIQKEEIKIPDHAHYRNNLVHRLITAKFLSEKYLKDPQLKSSSLESYSFFEGLLFETVAKCRESYKNVIFNHLLEDLESNLFDLNTNSISAISKKPNPELTHWIKAATIEELNQFSILLENISDLLTELKNSNLHLTPAQKKEVMAIYNHIQTRRDLIGTLSLLQY